MQLPNINALSLEQAACCAKESEIYEFIDAAWQTGLANTMYWVRKGFQGASGLMQNGGIPYIKAGSGPLLQLLSAFGTRQKQIIVDIDLDYFTGIVDKNEEKKEIRILKDIMKLAGVITFATSPGYIFPFRALDLTKALLD